MVKRKTLSRPARPRVRAAVVAYQGMAYFCFFGQWVGWVVMVDALGRWLAADALGRWLAAVAHPPAAKKTHACTGPRIT
jgi:TRAP-type C4-dicarboxylate transport system permease small subunit